MATNPLIVTSIAQFFGTTQPDWSALEKPVPAGTVAVATDVGEVKLGNGSDFYPDLPVLFNLQDMAQLWQFLNGDRRFLSELRVGVDAIAVNADGPGTISLIVGDQSLVLAKRDGEFVLERRGADGQAFVLDAGDGDLNVTAGPGRNIQFTVSDGGAVTINNLRVLTTADLGNFGTPDAITDGTSAMTIVDTTRGPDVALTKDGVVLGRMGTWAQVGGAVNESVGDTLVTNHTLAVTSPTGDLRLQAGAGGNTASGLSGTVTVKGGNATDGHSGGGVTISGGTSSGSGPGGDVCISGGTSQNGAAGNVNITAEAAVVEGQTHGAINLTAAGGVHANGSLVVTEKELGTFDELVAAFQETSQ